MARDSIARKLTVIFAADVVGYSRLTGEDEEGTYRTLKAYRAFIDRLIDKHKGRIFGAGGDSVIAEFGSAVEAVRCAVAIQKQLSARNEKLPEDRQMLFRIGINVGDVMIDGDDLLGDGVNVAARLESVAKPGGICISRNVFNQVKSKLKLGFEELGTQKVKNIAEPVIAYSVLSDPSAAGKVVAAKRRGDWYSSWAAKAAVVVLAAVVVGLLWWKPWGPGIEVTSISQMSRPLPNKPSIAVLPFANLSGDSQQGYFSRGITQDIRTELARVPGFFVPAGNSSNRYKGTSVDLQKVGRELGVRYVLEGSVQKSGDQVRVTAQLIEIANGSHVWAQRYDRPLTDLFAVQDEITEAIATRLVAQIKRVDLAVSRRKPTDRMDAYDLVLQGRDKMSRPTAKSIAEAKLLYERAVSYDANYADAYAGLAEVYTRGFIFKWGATTGPEALDKAIELGKRSLELNPAGAFASYTLALAYIFRRRLNDAEAVLVRAHAAYPNDADIMDRLGVTYVFQGRHQEGVDLLVRVLKVDPFHRRAIHALTARAYLMLKNYDRVAEHLKLCYAEAPNYRVCYEVAAVFYVETGKLERAREAVATLRRINPKFTIATAPAQLPFKIKADQNRFLDAFRKAGMPE